jgi:hypothetical protein
MANAAFYSVITDSIVTLNFGGDIDYETTFNLPQKLDVGTRSVISGVVVTLTNATNLTFKLEINDVDVNPVAPITGSERFNIQEVVQANLLKVGQNKFRIKLAGGAGSLSFSDVVLLYGVNV